MPVDALSREDAARRARLLGDVAYDVTLDLVPDAGRGDGAFGSTTRVTFACAEPGAATFVDLKAERVHRIVLNGEELDPADAVDGATVRLPQLRARNTLEIVADCAYTRTGVGLHRFVDPVDGRIYLHTQFEPFNAHLVFACFDQPDLKAPFALAVDAPAEWAVVSNGPVRSRPAEGEAGRWTFAPTLPVSTYITAVVAGPYAEFRRRHRDLDLGLWCRRSLAEHLDPDEIFTVTEQGFDFFEEAFGYAYPFGRDPDDPGAPRRYDQLFVPEFNFGAMENAACVTFSEIYVFRSKVTDALRERRAETILHEMAHMWFGNLVTMRWWDDLWLNESFATWASYHACVEATRFTGAWAGFTTGRKAWAYGQDQLPTTHPIVADIPDTEAVRTNFDGITYAKGASVLRQLVAWVGEDAFLEGLRGYFRGHEYGNAELADFLSALEGSSGRELDAWSKEWLETAGVATLRADAVVEDGRYRSVAVLQEVRPEHPTLRAHRLGVGLYDLRDDRLVLRRRVELDISGDRTDVAELAGEPVADLLLLNDADLSFAKVRLDERSLETLQSHLGAMEDPVARGLCWYAAWDMTRDAELPARRFVALVADHAEGETDVGVLQTLLGQATAALDRYGDPSNRAAGRARLAAATRAGFEASEPGSDHQLAWVRAYVLVEDDLAFARGLLDGSVEVPGLAVDTDLRWHLVTVLAARGAIGEAEIAEELERDPTDMGDRRAAYARAARPEAGAKAAAWQALLEDTELPLAMQRALLAGLWQAGQDELLRAYVERFADVVAPVWRERSADEALALTGGLYPSTIVDEAVVAAADRALADEDLPGPGRRLVLEGRDGTLRALRARAADRAAG